MIPVQHHIDALHARSVLESRMISLVNIILDRFEWFNSQSGPESRAWRSATRASIIGDGFYQQIAETMGSDLGIKLGDYRRQRYILFDGELVLRFKKLDQHYQSRNYPTQQAKRWNVQLRLPGMPPFARLEIGYQVDLTGTWPTGIFVLLRFGDAVQWLWQVYGAPESTFSAQQLLEASQADLRPRFMYDNFADTR